MRGLEQNAGGRTFVDVPEDPTRPRVLVVDDDTHVARALTRMLRKYCEVQVASSVSEAENVLSERTDFRLILCDLLLPERGGLDLYRGLKNAQSKMAPRLAFMTGLGEDATEAQEFGEVPCLGKPVDLDRIRELLAK